jgi:hypothetical protein
MPTWVKSALDQWLQSANIMSGELFRRVHNIGKPWGNGLTEKAVWHVVREYAAKVSIDKLAPLSRFWIASETLDDCLRMISSFIIHYLC